MSEGRLVKWKLKFHLDSVEPGRTAVLEVQSAHPFRGSRFTFASPESFNVERIQVGLLDQLDLSRDLGVPCAVLHGQAMSLDTSGAGVFNKIKIRNTSGRELPFYAELHGLALLGKEEVPRPSGWEDEDI